VVVYVRRGNALFWEFVIVSFGSPVFSRSYVALKADFKLENIITR